MASKSKLTSHNHRTRKGRTLKERLSNVWMRQPKRTWIILYCSILIVGLSVACSALLLHVETDRYKQVRLSYVHTIYTVAGVMSLRPNSTLVTSQGLLNVLHPTLSHRQRTFALNTCPSATDTVVKRLQKQSIAVLLDINNSPGLHQCTLAQIVQAYGRPNSSTTISGSITDPKEVLLFYDDGPELSGPVKPISPPRAPATVVPITLATLPSPVCSGHTDLSFVAHEDDDLLFMNPDLLHNLQSGGCLRTVYLTAGDAGLGSSYWLGREEGSEAAYDSMIGRGSSLWIERYVEVNSHEYIKMASPRGNPSVTLVFVELPDGNIPGTGFLRTHYESLAKLEDGTITQMDAVNGTSSYTKTDLTDLLVSLMKYFHPDQVDSQTPVNMSAVHVDHSDHMTAGQFTEAAFALYGQNIPIVYYTGYPIDQLPTNISGQDLADKSAAFYAYAADDTLVCKNPAQCAGGPYPGWLEREYTYTPGMLPIPPATTPAPSVAPTSPTTPTTPGPTTLPTTPTSPQTGTTSGN